MINGFDLEWPSRTVVDQSHSRLLSTKDRVAWSRVCFLRSPVLLVLIAALAGCATHQQDIAQMVVDAKTSADHEAIAACYEKEAASNELQASSHRDLAATYRRFHNTYKNMMAPHCEIAADSYTKIAAQDSELADQHRKLAQQIK